MSSDWSDDWEPGDWERHFGGSEPTGDDLDEYELYEEDEGPPLYDDWGGASSEMIDQISSGEPRDS